MARPRTGTMDISSMLEVQVKEEADVKENVTPAKDQPSSVTSTASAPTSQEEHSFRLLMFDNDIASVRFHRIHCTACDSHIGSAPAQIHNMFEHPVLHTLLCGNCREFYGDGTFEQGDDATDMFCRWCANGGNLYCCSYCSNTFCYKCIRRNFTLNVRRKIEADEKWKCFVCNPNDMYSARAICWAILQHVQTVTRILSQDKKMSAEEIEDKMNLDETMCCPRRSRRKRRRLESTSEEEDETYSPKPNGTLGYIKRKPPKRLKLISQTATNGKMEVQCINRIPIPIRPRPVSFLSGRSFDTESPKPAASKNSVTTSDSAALSSSSTINSNTSLPSRFDPSALPQQSTLYHTSFVNTSGSTTYIQTPVAVNRIILPPQSQPQLTYQSQQASSYQSSQSLQSAPNTMVSIPNPMDKHGRPLFILPKPKESRVTLTPNIIELDSDSDDEPEIITQQNLTGDKKNNKNVNDSNKVVPVALTWENNDDDAVREEPLMAIACTTQKDVSFSDMMLPHSQELDEFLSDTKKKVHNFFVLSNAIENIDAEAQQKIKHFYHNMRDTVFQLININDRIVRRYIEWRRSRKTEASSSASEKTLESSQENVDIPLNMICVNESDTESENERDQILEPSDLVKDNNIISKLFCKKDVLHRGVGNDSAHLSMDKAIQVYDIVSRDYEKVIGYSIISKTVDEPETVDDVLDPPAVSDKNFGKYEEQFIFYLQHIEDNGIETEETKSLGDSDETLQEVQTDPSFISHLLQDIDLPVESVDQSKNCVEKKNLSDSIDAVTIIDKSDVLGNNDKEIVNNSDTNTQEINMQLDDKLQQTESRETLANTMDSDASLNKNSDIINLEVVASTGNKDYTIIN